VRSNAGRSRGKTRKSENGIIRSRPGARVSGAGQGLHRLGLSGDKDGLLYVPETYHPSRPAALVLMLHGAGSNAHDAIQPFRLLADDRGLILLAPNARRSGWDLLDGGFGADVDFIDHALARTFEWCVIDPQRVAIEGFSDGGSYALALGLRNAELFTHIIAFSPGFMAIPTGNGRPKVFVSHGTRDLVLPAIRCSHRIVARLQSDGYEVTFCEFPGEHAVPPAVADQAVAWMLDSRPPDHFTPS
jgi:phospholipase/carboxylesterase